MAHLPDFTPRLDERLTAEFHAHSLALLPYPLHQAAAMLDASALRLVRPEPPRDPDLPLLPPKKYPRITPDMVEAAIRALQPPPPEDFVGRKAELDRAVMSLLMDRAVVLCGESGAGKSALLRQIAHDARIRAHFRRVWWLDDLYEAGLTLGLALEAPGVLIAPDADQPRRLREFLSDARTLLLIDSTAGTYTLNGLEWALGCAPHIAVATREDWGEGMVLGPLPQDAAVEWLIRRAPAIEDAARTLAALVDYRPGSLALIARLVNEDSLTPDMIAAVLENVSARRTLSALYSASFAAMPAEYQAVCRAFAATPRRWVALETALEHFENRFAGVRALTFLVRRGFLERRELDGVVALRVVGDWAAQFDEDEIEGFAPLPRLAERFDLDSSGEEAAQAEKLYAQGIALIDNCQDDEAKAALEQALAIYEASQMKYAVAQALVALARLEYLRGGDPIRKLETAAERLHDLHDEDGLETVRVALSRAYRRAGRLDAALSVLGDDSSPEDLAAVYRAREAWPEAIASYERWLKADGSDAARYGLAETHLLAGRYADALASVAGDNTFGGQYIRALAYHMQGEAQKALGVYTALQADTPPEYRSIVARAAGRAMAAQGDVRAAAMLVGAEGVWYEAKLARPAFARQRLSQALHAHFQLMLGSTDEAEAAARSVHALMHERPDPEAEAIACRVLGRIAWQNRQWDAAIHAFEAELSARGAMPHRDDHEIGVTLHNLADVQREAGETDRAIANYRRALTHKARDKSDTAETCMALVEVLATAGRAHEALEAGAMLLDLLGRKSPPPLRLYGYALSFLAKLQFEAGRDPRGTALLNDWIRVLAERHAEALDHPHWGVQVLAIGLYLRSAPLLDGDPVATIDLAERAMVLAAREAPGTWVAYAARRDLGDVYLRLGKWDEAREVYEPLLADPNGAAVAPFVMLAAHLGSARAAQRAGDLDAALTHFDAALSYEPDRLARGAILREAAEACRAAGDDARAADRYIKALPLLQSELAGYVDTLVALAYTRLRLRRFGEAIDTFEETLAIVEKSARSDPALMASVLFDMAAAHDSLGQYRRAAETYRRALNYQDRNRAERYLETLIALARSEANAESYQRAVEAYYDALQFEQFGVLSDTQRRALLVEQAAAFARLDQAQAAINAYDTALALLDNDTDSASSVERAAIHRGLGSVYARIGAHDDAREHFQAALDAVQDDLAGVTLSALADSYRAQGMAKEAVDTYHRALDFLDRKTNVLETASVERALGELYLERRQISNAITHLEASLDIERALPQQRGGRIVSLLQNLANAHEMRGELDKAAVRHHEALVYQDMRHAPVEYVQTLRTLGRLYMDMGRFGEAAKAYDEALRVEARQPRPDPDTLDALHLGLGNVRRAQGALEAAAEYYRRVTATPHDTPAHRQAAEALKQVSAEIARHVNALEAADQSLTLLSKAARPDLKGVVFVRALQAQASAALGRGEDAEGYLVEMFRLLADRRVETGGVEPVMQVFASLIEGWERESAGEAEAARESYRAALELAERDAKSNPSLLWAIAHKAKAKES